MKVYTLALLCAASLVSANAYAQWQWLDAQGRKVFSDLPPPNQVPPERILQRPGNVRPAAIPAPSGPAPATLSAPPAEGRGVDRELQTRKAAEEAEQARRDQALAQQQERQLAQQRQDNCVRARLALATLVDGRLVAHTNAQGERAYMDESARAQERQRAQGIIASDCGPAAAGAAARANPPSTPVPSALPSAASRPDPASPDDAPRPGASRRDPTPPQLARPGTARTGRPAEPAPPTIQ